MLRVAAKSRRDPTLPRKAAQGGGAAPPPSTPAPPPPPKQPPLKLCTPQLPKVPSLPDPLTDFAGQVDSLLKAAGDGLHFVEQRAKALP